MCDDLYNEPKDVNIKDDFRHIIDSDFLMQFRSDMNNINKKCNYLHYCKEECTQRRYIKESDSDLCKLSKDYYWEAYKLFYSYADEGMDNLIKYKNKVK